MGSFLVSDEHALAFPKPILRIGTILTWRGQRAAADVPKSRTGWRRGEEVCSQRGEVSWRREEVKNVSFFLESLKNICLHNPQIKKSHE